MSAWVPAEWGEEKPCPLCGRMLERSGPDRPYWHRDHGSSCWTPTTDHPHPTRPIGPLPTEEGL